MPAFLFHSTSGTSRRTGGCTSATRGDVTTRDYDLEHKDGARQYAYQFDTLLRRYIMRALDPFLPPGRALEMGCYTGDMTELIAERYPDLTVIEASGELVAAASA